MQHFATGGARAIMTDPTWRCYHREMLTPEVLEGLNQEVGTLGSLEHGDLENRVVSRSRMNLEEDP